MNDEGFRSPPYQPQFLMKHSEVYQLAREGNPKAISALLNQALADRGVTSRTTLKEGCLHVLLEAEGQAPDRYAMVDLVRAKVTNLDVESIKRVRVYGRETGEERPAWNQEFALSVGDYSSLVFSQSQEATPRPRANRPPTPSPSPQPAKPKTFSTVSMALLLIGGLTIVALGTYAIARQLELNENNNNSPPAEAVERSVTRF